MDSLSPQELIKTEKILLKEMSTKLTNKRINLVQLMDQSKMVNLGPHFGTFVRQGSATSPDKIFANKQHYFNTITESGSITTSDHIPIVIRYPQNFFLI